MASFNPSKYKDIVTSLNAEDISLVQEFLRLDNEDRKDDSQRWMTWFALTGMILYPLVVVTCDALNLDKASTLVSDMADMYFVSVSAIVMAFYGANAWTSTRRSKPSQDDTKES